MRQLPVKLPVKFSGIHWPFPMYCNCTLEYWLPTSEPVAPGWLTPHQLTTDECKAMVRTWAAAARNAVKAGFDVIEIHTAHGYLLASFLSPVSNTRNDEYGGDRAGRMRLPLEIVEAVRREMPATRARLSAT